MKPDWRLLVPPRYRTPRTRKIVERFERRLLLAVKGVELR